MGETCSDGGRDAGTQRTFDPETENVVVAVLDTVASARDATPTDLEPLTRSVDPDALTVLFSNSPNGTRVRNGRLVFDHGGCVVTVTSDGHVRARPTE